MNSLDILYPANVIYFSKYLEQLISNGLISQSIICIIKSSSYIRESWAYALPFPAIINIILLFPLIYHMRSIHKYRKKILAYGIKLCSVLQRSVFFP